jgi:hypothetical protein
MAFWLMHRHEDEQPCWVRGIQVNVQDLRCRVSRWAVLNLVGVSVLLTVK